MEDLIAQHLAHLRAGGYARTTIRKRGELLRRVDDDLPFGIESATVEELAGWLAGPSADRRRGRRAGCTEWSPAAKHNYYHHIRGFFLWACDENNPKLDYDPSAALARPQVPAGVPRPATDDQLAAALAGSGEPWFLAILLAAYAGLRCCELATIRRENIGEQDITIKGKGGKSRKVPTMPVVWAQVENLPRGPIGPSDDAQWISRNALFHFRRIGLDDLSMHRFRAWYATHLLRGGADLLTVSKLLGHANPATTAVYCLISDEQRQSAVQALPVLTPASC